MCCDTGLWSCHLISAVVDTCRLLLCARQRQWRVGFWVYFFFLNMKTIIIKAFGRKVCGRDCVCLSCQMCQKRVKIGTVLSRAIVACFILVYHIYMALRVNDWVFRCVYHVASGMRQWRRLAWCGQGTNVVTWLTTRIRMMKYRNKPVQSANEWSFPSSILSMPRCVKTGPEPVLK